MEDYIIRGMAADHQVRFFAAYSKNLVEEARKRHDTSPVATAALGRLLTAGAMMGTAGASSAAAPTPAARYTQGADYRGAQ